MLFYFAKVYHTFLFLFNLLRFLSPAYYKALSLKKEYLKLYLASQDHYINGNLKKLLPLKKKPFTEEIIIVNPDKNNTSLGLPDNYLTKVKHIAKQVDSKFSYVKNCLFLPKLEMNQKEERTDNLLLIHQKKVVALLLEDPFQIEGLEDLASSVLKEVESEIFHSYIFVDKVYIYRNLVCSQPDMYSWLWHYDNHPDQVLKLMIYLTPVSENNGPLEYLMDEKTGNPIINKTILPGLGKPFIETRILSRYMKRYFKYGYEPRKIVGPQGTMILFSENMIHKANVCAEGFRDVLVFQLRPILKRISPSLHPQWTGSFQHVDISLNPYHLSPVLKKQMLVG